MSENPIIDPDAGKLFPTDEDETAELFEDALDEVVEKTKEGDKDEETEIPLDEDVGGLEMEFSERIKSLSKEDLKKAVKGIKGELKNLKEETKERKSDLKQIEKRLKKSKKKK